MSRAWPDPAVVWLDHRSGLAPLEAWCAAHPGGRCHVRLGAGLTLPMVADPKLHLADDRALRVHARRVLAHYGLRSESLATWRSGRWPGAVMLAGLDLQQLRQIAQAHRVRLLGVRPAWAGALEQGLRQHAGWRRGDVRLAVAEPDLQTLLQLRDGRLAGIEVQWRLGSGASAAGGAALEPQATLDAQAPQATLEAQAAVGPGPVAPDFLRVPVRHPRRVGWLAAASGMVALAAVAFDHWPAAPVPQADLAAPTPQAQRWERAAAHRWDRVLATAETAAAAAPLQWLALEHVAVDGRVRLSGVAPDLSRAMAAASQVGQAPGVREALLAHAQTDAAAGGVVFEIQARLADGGTAP